MTITLADNASTIVVDVDSVKIDLANYNRGYNEIKELIQALSLAHAQLKEPLEAEHGDYRVYAEKTKD